MSKRLVLFVLLSLGSLSGCDVLLLSPTLPGIAPGLGIPITGRVLDSRTGLPIGHATVLSNFLSTALTDSQGHFSLYRAFGDTLSFARAGYTAVTYAGAPLQSGQDYYLDPQFPDDGQLPTEYASLQGTLTVNGSAPAANASVTFGGADSYQVAAGGNYTVAIHENAPGLVASGVIFGGILDGGPVTPPENQAPQPFDYQIFGYRFVDVPLSGNPNAAPVPMPALDASTATNLTTMTIQYGNQPANSSLETDIALDFGLLGSVPVARTFGSSVQVPLPNLGIATPRYLIDGVASATDGTLSELSKISLSTSALGANDFTLLPYPVPRGPSNGASGVGRWPTFSWQPVPGAASYYVELFEGSNLKPKWRGYTTDTSIGYPHFWDGDSNGGPLLSAAQASYSWSVHALDEDIGKVIAVASPSGARSAPYAPYRHRIREAITGGMVFTR